MTNPLHHTIRDRTKSRLFMVKQWIDRIQFQLEELTEDYVNAQVWGDASEVETALNELLRYERRLKEDVDIERKRMIEDGYAIDCERMVIDVECLDPDGDYKFLPMESDSLHRVLYLEKVEVWRKAVQS